MKKVRYRWILCLVLVLGIGLFFSYNASIYTKIYPVYRAIRGYGIAQTVSHYQSEQIGTFSIRYNSLDMDKLNHIEEIIHGYGHEVFDYFSFVPNRDIEVILFNNEKDLHGSLGIPHDQPTVGAYSGGKIALLAQQDMLVNSFVHELTHLVIDEMAGGNFPVWFTEGVALYMEYELLGYEWGKDLEDIELYSIEQLSSNFYRLDEYKAYRQAFVYLRDLIEETGWENFLGLLKDLKNGMDFSSEFMKF